MILGTSIMVFIGYTEIKDIWEWFQRFLDFFTQIHKYNFFEIVVVIISLLILLAFAFYIFLNFLKKDDYWENIKDKIPLWTIVLSGIIILGSLLIISTKKLYDFKISYSPRTIVQSDSICELYYYFENSSDLQIDINDVYFYITLNKESFSSINLKGNEELFPFENNYVIKDYPFNLPIGHKVHKKICLNMSYIEKNRRCEIITTCFSKNNLELVSIKTTIELDSNQIYYSFVKTIDTSFNNNYKNNSIVYTPLKLEEYPIGYPPNISTKYLPRMNKTYEMEKKEGIGNRLELSKLDSNYKESTKKNTKLELSKLDSNYKKSARKNGKIKLSEY